LSGTVNAQTTTDLLKNQRMAVRLGSNGLLSDSSGSPAISQVNGTRLMERAGVWMSAIDDNGIIRVSAHNVTGKLQNFWCGPMQLNNELAADTMAWNKVWQLNQEQVKFHKDHFKDNNYLAKPVINNWPGNGPSGYAKVLAPFVDNDLNDQLYQPKDGDYPYLTSESLMYSIANDNANKHWQSNIQSLGVELHTAVMGFSAEDTALSNCVMVRYSVFNRSARNYKNFRFSTVMNFAIGIEDNEYLGTDVGNKILFAINDTSEATFSNKLLSIGCMALNNQLSSTMYFENTPDPVNGLPVLDSHYVRLMTGYWKNNKRLVYGGNGVDASGSSARFVYPYNTDVSQGSLMWSDNERYQPGKRYGLMNFDSVSLAAGTGRYYDVVYFIVEEDSFDIKQIPQSCLKIKQVLNTKNLLKGPKTEYKNGQFPVLYPNPIKAGEKMVIKFTLESPTNMRIISLEGRQIIKINLDSFDNSIILPEDLAEGVYLLEYETLNTKRYIKFNLNH
jgi:hypothetical protein